MQFFRWRLGGYVAKIFGRYIADFSFFILGNLRRGIDIFAAWWYHIGTTYKRKVEAMKKRLLALLLVLLICLTACDENRRPDLGDEATSFEDITPSKYIEIADKDYKGFDLYLNIYDYTEAELEQKILNSLYIRRPEEVYKNDDPNYIPKITAGDEVHIYYRGYILNEDGTRDYQGGMTNIGGNEMSQLTPYELTIGKGQFITGFEGGMAGKSLADFPTLEFITEGAVTDGLIVYVSSALRVDGKITASMKCTPFRIPEDKEYIDEYYDEDFYETICSLEIGGDPATLSGVTQDGGTYSYENIRIEYACAPYESTGCQPLYMRFPVDYSYEAIQGKEAWFEVYVAGITEYYNDEAGQGVFDDTFVNEKFLAGNDTLKTELDTKYPGLSPAEQMKKHIKERIDEDYDMAYGTTLYDAIIDHYVSVATVKKYPKALRELSYNEILTKFESYIKTFEKIYNAKVEDVEDTNGDFVISPGTGTIGGSLVYTVSKDNVAKMYFGDYESATWEEAVSKRADELLLTRLVVAYIIEREGLDVSGVDSDRFYHSDRQKIVLDKVLADFGIHIHTLDE